MEFCIRCKKSEEEVRLFDGIYITEPVKICERCSLLAQVPIIKRPTPEQLKESEKPFGVRQRLTRIMGISPENKKEKSLVEELREIEKVEQIKPTQDDLVFKLVDNFKWIIQTQRRRKGVTVKQLAEQTGESESAILMLEKGIVPSKSLDLIIKIEQALNINIIKKDLLEKIEEQKKIEKKRRILDEEERERRLAQEKEEEKKNLLKNPEINPLGKDNAFEDKMKQEEGTEMVKEAINEEKDSKALEHEKVYNTPMRPVDFRRVNPKDYTIADLKRIDAQIDEDFSYNKKSKEEVGAEQFESFGKEDTTKINRKIREQEEKKHPDKYKSTPSIYDLMKKKEERDKQMTGKDIEVIPDKNQGKDQAEFDM